MKLFSLFVLLGLTLSSLPAKAGEIQLELHGRKYVRSCSYFNSEEGDYSINFSSRMLAWGTRVFVVTGWKGYRLSFPNQHGFEWAHRQEQEATSVGPYQWRAEVHQVLHGRTSSDFLTHLQFAIRVEEPGKAPVFYPLISWAFYEAKVAGEGLPGSLCAETGTLPRYELIRHEIIERN